MRFLVLLFFIFASPALADEIWLGATTTLRDSGFLDYILEPLEEETGHEVVVLAQPTGQILQTARDGNVDLLLTHNLSLEQEFIDQGFGLERIELMNSNFVLVGPSDDPAKVRGLDMDLAFEKIAKEKPVFVSRDDESGTFLREEEIWRRNGLENLDFRIMTGQGMGASLNIASAMNAYIFADEASFSNFSNKRALAILVTSGKDLENIYAVTRLNGQRFESRNLDGAEELIEYLLSDETRERIEDFHIGSIAPFSARF